MFLFLLSISIFTLLGVGILKNRSIKTKRQEFLFQDQLNSFFFRKLNYSNKEGYFRYYPDAIWDLYVLTTTANNPDVM